MPNNHAKRGNGQDEFSVILSIFEYGNGQKSIG